LNSVQTRAGRPRGVAARGARRVNRIVLVMLSAGLSAPGCSEETRLSADGATPYARCLARSVGAGVARRVGGVSLELEDGVLEITGLPVSPRVLVAAGPGPGPAPWSVKPGAQTGAKEKAETLPVPDSGLIAAVTAARPSLVVVLGDLGDQPALASATAAMLDRLGLPVLVLGGGRDTLATLREADGLPNVVDLSPLRAVRLIPDAKAAPYGLIPVAGALDGRYARTKDGCGYAPDDLDERELPEPLPGERRLLLAWQGAVGGEGFEHAGADTGNPALVSFAKRAGSTAGLFAWPHAQAGRLRSTRDGAPRAAGVPVEDLGLVVPRLAGPAIERADGSRLLPGFALVELGAQGPLLRELVTVRTP
jgi:hypothetical protein